MVFFFNDRLDHVGLGVSLGPTDSDLMGLTTPSGKNLARSNIAQLFRNPVYIGKVVYGRRSNPKFEKMGGGQRVNGL